MNTFNLIDSFAGTVRKAAGQARTVNVPRKLRNPKARNGGSAGIVKAFSIPKGKTPLGYLLKHNSPAAWDVTLTSYAQGYAGELVSRKDEFLSGVIAPWVMTGAAQGNYKTFKRKESFAVYDALRPIQGNRARVAYDADMVRFTMLPYGLEIPIDDYEREQSGMVGGFNIERSKTIILVNAAMRSREKAAWDFVKANKTAEASTGSWVTNPTTTDPVADINAAIAAIATDTGVMPNEVTFSLGAYSAFLSHPKIASRIAGITYGSLGLEAISSMFINPNIKVRVGWIPYDTTVRGVTQANANIMGAEVFIYYSSPNPDTMDASFCKTFSISGQGVQNVKQYRENDLRTILAVDWTEEIQMTSPLSGRRITIS